MQNGKLPTLEHLEKAALMKTHLGVGQEYEALKFFWDIAAPAVLGNHSWGDSTRQNRIMMNTYIGDGTAYPLFTPSNLAFILLQLENGYDKFHAMAEWKQANPGVKLLPKPPTKQQKTDLEKKLEENKNTPIPLIHRMHDAKCTFANGGRRDYGGWNLVGLERQRSLTQRIKKRIRAKTQEIRAMQVNFLQKWREEMEQADKENDGNGKKKRKLATDQKESKKKQRPEQGFNAGGLGDSDSEEESEDDYESDDDKTTGELDDEADS